MLKLPYYTKTGVGILKTDFLACLYEDRWTNLALERPIWDLGQRALFTYHVFRFYNSLEVWREKENVPKASANFQ